MTGSLWRMPLGAVGALLGALLGAQAEPAAKWHPWVEFGAQLGTERSLGDGNLFAPLWQNDASLLFVDMRGMFDDHDAREGNLGLGVRHMLDSGWNLGAYAYLDARRSALDNSFWQTTLGFEALSRNVDLRGNVYLPLGDSEKRIDLGTQTAAGFTAPAAVMAGGTLAVMSQTWSGTSATFLTEKAMAGVDAEVGVRLPVFPEKLGLDLRAYAGGYIFDAPGYDSISGPRARLELTARDVGGLPGVRLTAGLTYQDDNVRGEQVIASARLRVPLQAPSRRRSEPLSYMEQRMLDAVVRDVDIVASSRVNTEMVEEVVVTTYESAINAWNGEVVTSVVEVDASQGEAALQDAFDNAGPGAVIVANGAFALGGEMNMGAWQTLLGGGAELQVFGAFSGDYAEFAAPGAVGTLEGPVNGSLLQMTSGSVVGGMTMRNNFIGFAGNTVQISNAMLASIFSSTIEAENSIAASPIWVDNSTNVNIFNNHIRSYKASVVVTGASSVNIYNNDVESELESAISIRNNSASVEIVENRLAAHVLGEAGVRFTVGGTGLIAGNTFDSYNSAYAARLDDATVLLADSVDNVFVPIFGPRCSFHVGTVGDLGFVDGFSC